MTNEMRRKERAISSEEAMELLEHGEYGILSLCGTGGHPYGVPLSYCMIDNAIFFHSAREGRKIDCLAENSSVSFTVVGSTEVLPEKFSTRYESVIVTGRAIELFGNEKKAGLAGLVYKYSPGFIDKGMSYVASDEAKTRVFKICIGSLTGKARR